jgi:hypothetical protein
MCYGKNVTGSRFIMVCLSSMEKKHREAQFCSEQTQQIKQEDQRIYVIILTDLNEKDENIKGIKEGKKYLK